MKAKENYRGECERDGRRLLGYGLEPVIPDGYVGGVLRGIRPILRQGNYGGAIGAAIEQFGDKVAKSKGVDLGSGAPSARVERGPAGSIPWTLRR